MKIEIIDTTNLQNQFQLNQTLLFKVRITIDFYFLYLHCDTIVYLNFLSILFL